MGMHYGYNVFVLPMGSSCSKPGFWCQEILTFSFNFFVIYKNVLLWLMELYEDVTI